MPANGSVTGIVIAITVVIPNIRYNTAKEYMANGEYDKAIDTFESLNKEDYSTLSEGFMRRFFQKRKDGLNHS